MQIILEPILHFPDIFQNFTTIFFDFLQIISSENYYEKLFKNSKKLLKNMQNI